MANDFKTCGTSESVLLANGTVTDLHFLGTISQLRGRLVRPCPFYWFSPIQQPASFLLSSFIFSFFRNNNRQQHRGLFILPTYNFLKVVGVSVEKNFKFYFTSVACNNRNNF